MAKFTLGLHQETPPELAGGTLAPSRSSEGEAGMLWVSGYLYLEERLRQNGKNQDLCVCSLLSSVPCSQTQFPVCRPGELQVTLRLCLMQPQLLEAFCPRSVCLLTLLLALQRFWTEQTLPSPSHTKRRRFCSEKPLW